MFCFFSLYTPTVYLTLYTDDVRVGVTEVTKEYDDQPQISQTLPPNCPLRVSYLFRFTLTRNPRIIRLKVNVISRY